MSRLLKKVKHIILGWYYYFKGIEYEVTRERLDVCDVCEFKEQISKKHSICSKCGCYLLAKTRVPDEHCPIEKW